MFRSFMCPRLAAALLLVPACACLPVLSLPGYAQGKKQSKVEEQGSYVYMEGRVVAPGWVSDNLFIQGNITGGLEGNGEYSSRPTHFWIKNWGTKSCFISGEQTGFTVGSAGSEIKPGETLRSGLAIYRPKGNPITSINITLKAWVPTNPPPPKVDALQLRKMADAQALFESSMQRYEAMKEQLQAGGTAWGQLPDAARDNALRQQLDALAASRQQALQRMGRFMEGYKRGDFSDLDAVLSDVDKINIEMQEQATQLKLPTLPTPQKPQQPAPRPIPTNTNPMSATFDGLPQKTTQPDWSVPFLARLNFSREALTYSLDPGDGFGNLHEWNVALSNIDLSNVVVATNQGFSPALFISLKQPISFTYSHHIIMGKDLPLFLPVSLAGMDAATVKNAFIALIQEKLGGETELPSARGKAAGVAPAIDPKLLQNLQAAHDALKQQTQSLPKQADSVSSLAAVPPAIRSQYAQIMNGLEGKNVEAVSKSLAPDYFYKDAEGTVLPLSKWKAAQTDILKTYPRLHMVVRVEGQEQRGDALVVTATRAFENTGGESAASRLTQKVKETWTQTGGQYRLQSTEVMEEQSTDPASYARRGDAFLAVKKWVEMEAAYRKAVALRPDNALYQYCFGYSLHWQDKNAEAEDAFFKAATIEPGNALYRNFLGWARHQQGKFPSAEAELRQAIVLEPNKSQFRSNLGACLYWQGKYGAAEEQYREAIRLDPKSALAYAYLTDSLFKQNRRDEAIVTAKKAIELGYDKNHPTFKELGVTP